MALRRHTAMLSALLCGALVAACMVEVPVQPTPAPQGVEQETAVAPACGETSARPADADGVRVTIVYDNTTTDPELTPDWGFAAAVEWDGHTLLFDSGGRPSVLLANLQGLGFDPSTIEAVVLSHGHEDHTGGLQGLLDLGVKPPVYMPSQFLESFKQQIRAQTEIVEVDDAVEILPGVHTTRPMGSIVEQALVVETQEGAVMITGCAHPGIVEMVRAAQESVGQEIVVLIGGFHLLNTGEQEIQSIIAELRQLRVQRILPSHCTGAGAIAAFRTEYGESYIEGGVGRMVSFATNN